MTTFKQFFSGTFGVFMAIAVIVILLTVCCVCGIVALPVIFPVTPTP